MHLDVSGEQLDHFASFYSLQEHSAVVLWLVLRIGRDDILMMRCLEDQTSLLLVLKNSLIFNSSASQKLVRWNRSTDCCCWDGVECDVAGHVTSLQLDEETISSGIENSEYLFRLNYLEKLNLANNCFNKIQIPMGLINLTNLTYLNLSNAGFAGQIPSMVANLTELSLLDISENLFTGPIPLFHLSEKLTYIDASHNSLTGSLSSMHFAGLPNLVYINLRYNLLRGDIPSSLFALPSLQQLYLSNNEFHGPVQEFSNSSSSRLEMLDLSYNLLEGPIPKFFSQLEWLKELSLSSNVFNDTVQLGMFKNPNLSRLDLSYNDLFIDSNHSNSSFPGITVLYLASCKLQEFPQLSRQSRLAYLDLSSNKLKGKIPNWIWEIGHGSLLHVNLSFNRLDGFQRPYKFPSLVALDLHSNQFHGELPIPPMSSQYVDFSFNYFSKSIPYDIGNLVSDICFLYVSNNNLTGEIPTSICNATSLKVLHLSGNSLTGTIPSCFPKENLKLAVLSLARNNLSGNIPNNFSVNCSLRTLDLEKNVLEGIFPRSLVNCPFLEVLNIGKNRIEDTFPCILMKTGLRVLILRSNKFYGDLHCFTVTQGWLNLQLIDISNNNFGGNISMLCFSNWWGMIGAHDNEQSQYKHLYYELGEYYYQDTVTVTMKGLEMELKKILIIFTSIDFSRNKFHGSIPYTIGDLKYLYLLNLSHNTLIGAIPASIGNLRQLGSLDLSTNHVTGKIPVELVSLTFLSFLNLSFNNLFGMIPQGSQFQTFSAASYEGNAGLCGFPVTLSCNDDKGNRGSPRKPQNGLLFPKKEIDWDYVSAAMGFSVGLTSTVATFT